MRLENLDRKIKEKEDELNKLKEQYKKESIVKSKVVERVNIGEFYSCIDGCLNSLIKREENHKIDDLRFNSYNYFKDIQKGIEYASFLKLEIKLFRIREKIRDGWKPDFNDGSQKCCLYYKDDRFYTNWTRTSRSFLLFQNEDKVKEFIDLAGEDNIKKYLNF